MATLYKAKEVWTGTLASAIPDGTTTSFTLSSSSGLTNGEKYLFTIDRVDASGTKTPSKKEVIPGTLSGSNVINCTRGVEGTAQAHSSGAIVEVLFNAKHWSELIDYLETEHNADGTHKSALVTTLKATGAEINAGTEDAKIVTPKAIADSNIVFTTKTQTLTNKTLTSPLFQGSLDGWILADETWTYASSTTFTISGDLTGKYQKGDKIRLKQGGGYKYFYITAVSHASGTTTVTVTGGNNYSLVNNTITDNFYSKAENPQGFPSFFTYTPTVTATGGSLGSYTSNGLFNIKGGVATVVFGVNITNAGTGSDSINVSLPLSVNSSYTFCGCGGLNLNDGCVWGGSYMTSTSIRIKKLNNTFPGVGTFNSSLSYAI